MQSSYRIIKDFSVKNNGLKEIRTDAEQLLIKPTSNDIDYKNTMDSYENIANAILANAKIQKDKLMASVYDDTRKIQDEAIKNAELIKKQAFEEGYAKGQDIGFKVGMKKAEEEGNRIIESAEELLLRAKNQYEKYFESKKDEIYETILTITETIVKRELSDRPALNRLILEALETSKASKNFIIRCNDIHAEELNSQIINWKEELGFMGDIFIVKDNSLEPGNAVIDKGNGKIIVGIDCALQKVRELTEDRE